MNLDDWDPKTVKQKAKDLEPLGLEELAEYIAELEVEIARTRQEITRKEKHRKGLDGLFRS
ncbi:DUF1192 domain-containing protein [Kiloniella laminariae]|uniref:DUF1192 domain-containing protein n=1 Tax=Kiloniella laminariae TaxID=454162 RepID=UPI0003A75861|nr:DUF1192 domain-containing protein [Kiloniella laminariae]